MSSAIGAGRSRRGGKLARQVMPALDDPRQAPCHRPTSPRQDARIAAHLFSPPRKDVAAGATPWRGVQQQRIEPTAPEVALHRTVDRQVLGGRRGRARGDREALDQPVRQHPGLAAQGALDVGQQGLVRLHRQVAKSARPADRMIAGECRAAALTKHRRERSLLRTQGILAAQAPSPRARQREAASLGDQVGLPLCTAASSTSRARSARTERSGRSERNERNERIRGRLEPERRVGNDRTGRTSAESRS